MGELWDRVDHLLDRANGGVDDLLEHRVHLLAAQGWRAWGQPVPPRVADEERSAALRTLAVPLVLERVRAAYDGPLLLLKGAEAAASYRDPFLRPFKDLDLLVPDAGAAQKALVASGFKPVGNPDLYLEIHHERPLWLPGQPLMVEIHREPKWPGGLAPPSAAELFESAVPSAVGAEGVLALPPGAHAVVLAAHSWAHEPLRRLIELIDVAALVQHADRAELVGFARRWGVERIWRTTLAASDSLLGSDGPLTWPLRLWARNLPELRGRTVLESHVERWLAGYWARPPREALREMGSAAAREVSRAPGESWGAKLVRTRRAAANPFARRSEHDLEWRNEIERLRGRR
jgi:hypothetical protein